MKTKFVLTNLLICLGYTAFSTVWVITNSGNSFQPNNITISQGDTVIFQLTSVHNAIEVSQGTWNDNGTTPLTGGFQIPLGGGTVLPAQLGAGTHYYVCTPHANLGMKGTINVETATGIDMNILDTKLSLYPNPASNQILVETSNIGSTYRISDLIGRILSEGVIENSILTIDINVYPPGIYFFMIEQYLGKAYPFIKK